MDERRFAPASVIDATCEYAPHIPKLPFGAFFHATVPFANPEERFRHLQNLILVNAAGVGLLIPANYVGDEWKFNLSLNAHTQLALELQGITLMVAHEIKQIAPPRLEVVGAAQPLYALQKGKGSCFERAAILTAIFRHNGIPSRIVGNPAFMRGIMDIEIPAQQNHWWVEAYVGGIWTSYDPSFNYNSHRAFEAMLPSVPATLGKLERFFIFAQVSMQISMERMPFHIIDDPHYASGLRNVVTAPEIDVPETYANAEPVF